MQVWEPPQLPARRWALRHLAASEPDSACRTRRSTRLAQSRGGQDRTLGTRGGGRPGRTHAAVPVVCRRGPCAASGRDRVLLRSVTVCDACPACLLLASPRTTPRFLLGASCALSPLLHLLPAISFASLPHHTALSDYSAQYETARGTYLEAAKALKMATGPYKASRDAYVAAGVCRLADVPTRARAHTHTHAFVCMYVCMHACMHVYVCMHVCMYVCACVCVCLCVCVLGRANPTGLDGALTLQTEQCVRLHMCAMYGPLTCSV